MIRLWPRPRETAAKDYPISHLRVVRDEDDEPKPYDWQQDEEADEVTDDA